MKKKFLKTSNSILAAILAMFGISSCDDGTETLYGVIQAAYGCPQSEYIEITGTVKNEARQPVENIQVVSEWENGYIKDTTYTDQNGNFEMRKTDTYPSDNIKLYFYDTDGTDNGSYQNDTADVQITYSGGDGEWNVGVGRGSVDMMLKEKTE